MSEVQRLLEQATPLPWTLNAHEWEDGTTYSINPAAPVLGRKEDAALIVYAVNRLPDYEAAVEALERLVRFEPHHAAECAHERFVTPPCDCDALTANHEARAALARLRDRQEMPR